MLEMVLVVNDSVTRMLGNGEDSISWLVISTMLVERMKGTVLIISWELEATDNKVVLIIVVDSVSDTKVLM